MISGSPERWYLPTHDGHWGYSDIGACSQTHICFTKPHTALLSSQLSGRGSEVPMCLCVSHHLHTREARFCDPHGYILGVKQDFTSCFPAGPRSYPSACCQHIIYWVDATENICLISNLLRRQVIMSVVCKPSGEIGLNAMETEEVEQAFP